MKTCKVVMLMGLALVALGPLQGCFLAVLTGAVGGTAYGTAKYVRNTLQVDQASPLDKTWDAANAALAELKMPVTSSKKDEAYGKLEASNAQGQPVSIELMRRSDSVTRLRITVGTFDSPENRVAAQQIYDKMKSQGEANSTAGKPS
jgi:hypothetical protein